MSKIISYDYGHMEGGQDTSANGILYEYTINRQYGKICVDILTQAGYTMVNCTPLDNSGMTLIDSLSYRVDRANASDSILHLCFHANAFQATENPMGSEIEVASDNGAKYGQSILNEIVKLGFISRGINRPNLYVTKNTNMVCCLVEPFFIDSKADCNLYNPQKLGQAIAQGVVNILGGTITPVSPIIITPAINNDVVPIGSNITPLNGGAWLERVSDGREILHQSRSVYLALTPDGHLNFTANGIVTKLV